MPFELRPYPNETLRPEGDYLQRAWHQSVYPIARMMGVPIKLPDVSPQPHTHLAFEGYQYAREHGQGNAHNDRVLQAFFVETRTSVTSAYCPGLPARKRASSLRPR
jgi:predicted DsbA family dithiol-disulfide isomerase